MSDKEESKLQSKDDSSDDSGEEWIGPMPTEAVPAKKRKGIIYFIIFFYIVFYMNTKQAFLRSRLCQNK